MYLSSTELKDCPSTLWTSARFGNEALAQSNRALDRFITQIKRNVPDSSTSVLKLNLIGYSGGGALATLLAARRGDVACVVTIASPLDIEAWAQLKKVAPLSESFNPAYPDQRLQEISQNHWYGANDKIVPPESLGRYQNWPSNSNPKQLVRIMPGFNHQDFWVRDWSLLSSQTCLNEKNESPGIKMRDY
jgi:pimeloyl-ACP methyl ester carboxylesterase